MPTTEEVLASHEAALAEQNRDRISTHDAKDAVVIVNGPRTVARQRSLISMQR